MELMKSIPGEDFDLGAHCTNEDYSSVNMKVTRNFSGLSKSIYLKYDEKKLGNIDVRRGLERLSFVSNSGYHNVYMKINVSHLIGYSEPRRKIRICQKDFGKICSKLQELIRIICQDLYEATSGELRLGEDFRVNRIDYAIDIKTRHASEYIRLLKKGDIPAKMHDCGYSNSLYYSNGSKRSKLRRVINCYDKTKYSAECGIRAEKDILRFEIQLGIKQIENFMEKHALGVYREYIKDKELKYLLEIAPLVLLKYYEKLVYQSNFYTKPFIEEKIKDLPDKEQIEIKNYLQKIVRKGNSIKKLKSTAKKSIKLLEELGINPIPLGSKVGVQSLKGIYKYIVEIGVSK